MDLDLPKCRFHLLGLGSLLVKRQPEIKIYNNGRKNPIELSSN
jgi:hypothetical protein